MSEPTKESVQNQKATEPSDEFESPNPSEVTKHPEPPTDEFETHKKMQKLHERSDGDDSK